ncbi:hypothetical protein [Niveispirillum sp. BGYR6]|uniref:hypothetical protein n=1 Tax=Niveispirillum sp. BGYR6 TaxID=2971249 RepID=UPI0022B95E14|nr:hypothetical protein [Niveispirillum sp. BGYR6]MDG5498066.1 hypothetical protein [Niveispirillum sp. BGYR6]
MLGKAGGDMAPVINIHQRLRNAQQRIEFSGTGRLAFGGVWGFNDQEFTISRLFAGGTAAKQPPQANCAQQHVTPCAATLHRFRPFILWHGRRQFHGKSPGPGQ